MMILLIGAPGAGKGTQADLLVGKKGFRKISTGDALRKHVKLGTSVGKQAESIMARGELVSDDVLLQILKEELGTNTSETVILDGYPRNVAQAKTLAQLESSHPMLACVHLDLNRDEIVARLSGRRVCASCGASFHVDSAPSKVSGICDKCGGKLIQRPDDEPKSISVRLDVYDKNTEPVLDYYRQRHLYRRVNGAGEQEKIFQEILDVIAESRA